MSCDLPESCRRERIRFGFLVGSGTPGLDSRRRSFRRGRTSDPRRLVVGSGWTRRSGWPSR